LLIELFYLPNLSVKKTENTEPKMPPNGKRPLIMEKIDVNDLLSMGTLYLSI